MDRLQRAVILTELMDRLRANESWCGETHVQKAVYFLQEVLGVQIGFEYILYKHGPYSFDLTADLTALRADFLMEFNHRSPGYGPGLVPTPTSQSLRAGYPKTLAAISGQIEFIAKTFGTKGVADLERLATALYVTKKDGAPVSVEGRARRLVELKPHVPFQQALDAVREFDRIAREAADLAIVGSADQSG
jgi:uncharacterized protein YwgA